MTPAEPLFTPKGLHHRACNELRTMQTASHASDLERRKQVKIRLRPDLDIAPQKYEGRTYWVVKDPVSLRYYRFKEQEYYLLGYMDGRHTLDDAQKAFEKRFRPDRLTLEDLEHFAQQLLTAGLVQNESPQGGKQLFDRRKKRKRRELMQTLTNILYIKLPIFDPDKLLTKMLRYTRWIFSTPFLLASLVVMFSAIMLVATHFETFREKLPSYHEFFQFKTIIYLWVALGVVKVIHEFGHGLSCKAFGGEVHEMGFLLLCLSPAMYCNVSDSWTLPNKWHRIIIAAAGIWVELIIASIATFVWWNTPSQPFINNLALSLMIVCSVSTVVFNANPLMRYDGYYVLADWLEIPNLRDRSNRYLQNLVLDKCLGVEVQPEPYMALWRRILFVTYAVVSYIYRWVVTFAILYFLGSFLKPYKLEVIRNLMVLFAAGSMAGWPLFNLGKYLYKRGRIPDMKQARVLISLGILGLIVVAFFVVPLPVSRVRQMAVIEVRPENIAHLFVLVPGVLEDLQVHDGQTVPKGYVLARLYSREVESKLSEAIAQATIRKDMVAYLQAERDRPGEPEMEKVAQGLATAKAQQKQYEDQVKYWEQMKESLILKAPRAGVVMSSPRINDVGKLWDKGLETPFCSIGEPVGEGDKRVLPLRAVIPVTPSDYSLIKEDFESMAKEGQELGVTIRVQGRDANTWKGVLTRTSLPEQEATSLPVGLTTKGGGPLAIKPNQQPGVYVPQAQVYLLTVDFVDPDNAIYPGTLGQVKIHCRWRSCAWWTWRTICDVFELRLM
jgi:putative peptide zinc metalloprotease protein